MDQQFTIAKSVYDKSIEKAGKIVKVSKDKELYLVECDNGKSSFWSNPDSLLLLVKPNADKTTNIPIRSIKSLYKKAANNPSANLAEKKAIDLYIHMVYSVSNTFTVYKYKITDMDIETFSSQMKYLEKMALEFYKTIKP